MPNTQPPPKHEHETLHFPPGFLWGAATSAHQVEGQNTNSDWWEWEKTHLPENKRSGKVVDQYHRFEQDFELVTKIGHNAHRLSIEWSRIEPEEGKFDEAAIEHYIQVLSSLKKKGMTERLTLHHFTNPLWLAKNGGWENLKTPFYFERFVKTVVPRLESYVDLWVTIKEPSVLVWCGYIEAKWPPQKKNKISAIKAMWNLSRAHKKAYRIIHQFVPNAAVGIAHNVSSFEAFHHHSILEDFMEWFMDISTNHLFYYLTGKNTHDFLGLNYYFNQYINFSGEGHFPEIVDIETTKKDVSDLGWEIHPEGIFDVIMDFSDYHKPVYITENGLASTNDDRRVRFLLSYLKEIYHAIQSGVQVKGYFHWSLMDNYEWSDGFSPRFGLIEVDYKTLQRTPLPSAYVYQEIIENNGIPHYLLKLLGHSVDVKDVLKKDQKA